jgi:uncharacterized protein (TIGR00369 family)
VGGEGRWTVEDCFGCGSKNEFGLQLRPRVDPDGIVRADVVGKPFHRGYTRLLHGGVITAAMDEVLAYAVSRRAGRHPFVTTSIEVRFVRPAFIGARLVAEARCTAKRGDRFVARAWLKDADGKVLSEATGRFVKLPERLRAKFLAR